MIDWHKIYALLNDVTPLKTNCGELCGAICCTEWDEGVGMYLLPGEEVMFSGEEEWADWEELDTEDYEFCPSWSGKVKFLRCKGYCQREKRPLACRIFPLMPYLTKDGTLELRWDKELGRICPLVQAGDLNVLDKKFISRVKQVYMLLLEEPLIREDIEWQSRNLDDETKKPLEAP